MDAVGNEVIHLLTGEIALVVSGILNIVKSQAESLQIRGLVLGVTLSISPDGLPNPPQNFPNNTPGTGG